MPRASATPFPCPLCRTESCARCTVQLPAAVEFQRAFDTAARLRQGPGRRSAACRPGCSQVRLTAFRPFVRNAPTARPRFAVRNAASRWYTSRSATASTRSRSRPKMTRRSSASVALVTMTASGWSAATSVRIGCTRAASASTTARRSLRTFLSPSSSASSEPAQPNHSTRFSAERRAALHRCCKKIRPAAIEVQMPKIYYWGMASPRR